MIGSSTAASLQRNAMTSALRPRRLYPVATMSLSRVDARFLLPYRARHVLVIGHFPEWTMESAIGDMRVIQGDTCAHPIDLVVADGVHAAEAFRTGADMAIIESPGLRPHNLTVGHWRRILALPCASAPQLYVPLGHRRALIYALKMWLDSRGIRCRARDFLSGLSSRVIVTVAPLAGPPFALAAARDIGVPADSQWFFMPGVGDPRDKRNVFQIFPRGLNVPRLVLKVGHFANQRTLFEDEEAGRQAAQQASYIVSARAPRLFGRFDAHGLPASLEEAAAGKPLLVALRSSASRTTKLGLIERVCAWLSEVAAASLSGPENLNGARKRLTSRIVPEWAACGAPQDLVERITAIPATFAHNDLNLGNVVHSRSHFMILDWERARRYGFPLWDLWLFLSLALPVVDGAAETNVTRVEHFAALFGGISPSSEVLFKWTHRLVDVVGLRSEDIGPLATLCWLDHGIPRWLVPPDLQAPLADWVPYWAAGRSVVQALLASRRLKTMMAQRWLSDGRLGARWQEWRR
jgi:hypothetical protein